MFERWEKMVRDQKQRKEELRKSGKRLADEAKRVKNPHVKRPNFTRS